MPASPHVIIVGAGAAGLMAARLLQQKNISVTVLEARERLGGRIHTLHEPFRTVAEAGAEFIHGRQAVTTALLKEANSDSVLLSGKFHTIVRGQLQHDNTMEEHWDTMMEKLQSLAYDTDMATFLNEHFAGPTYDNFKEQLRRYVEGYDIADLRRVSALELRKEWMNTDDEHQYHVAGGYERLVRFLALKIESAGGVIHRAKVVEEIQWSAGKAGVLTTNGERFYADKIIVTVPLGVLQKRHIRFIPAIRQYEEAIDAMGFGGVIKFLFAFNTPFWEQHRGGTLDNLGFVFSDAPVPTWWSKLPDKTPLLTGWLGGPGAEQVDHNVEALYAKALSALQYIFDCPATEIESHLGHYHVADWTRDSFTHGAYSYPTTSTAKARAVLSTPLAATVYFAGEAVYDGAAMGTVEAALVSGIQVATKVVVS